MQEEIDRDTDRALCDAGYMSVSEYVRKHMPKEEITGLEIDPNNKIIYTYIGIDDNVDMAYYIYDPETDNHHKVSKEKYEEVMRNVHE